MLGCAVASIEFGLAQVVETRLTNAPGHSWTSFGQTTNSRSVAANGNMVHVTWMDERAAPNITSNIYYKRSADGGLTWGPDNMLSVNTGNDWAFTPSIEVVGSRVHVVWQDSAGHSVAYEQDIYHRRSLDGGLTWEPVLRLSFGNLAASNAVIAASGAVVNVLYQRPLTDPGGDPEIFQVRSTDGGATWSAETQLTNDSEFSSFPAVAVHGNDLHLAWSSGANLSGDDDVRYMVSHDLGVTFGTPQVVVNSPGLALGVSLAITPGSPSDTVHLAWMDNRFAWDIYYQRSLDGGTTWGAELALANTTSWEYFPFLETHGSDVHMAWYELGSMYSVRHQVSNDVGGTWNAPDTIVTQFELAAYASIDVEGGFMHMIWADGRHGAGTGLNDEIYYRRTDTGGGDTGVKFCDPAELNSTGQPTLLTGVVSSSAGSGLHLEASQGPSGQFGYFLIGTGASDPGIAISQGRLCLDIMNGNQIGRYNVVGGSWNSIGLFDAAGVIQNATGTSATGSGFDVPSTIPTIGGTITAGTQWHFQLWHRESAGSANFSNGLSFTF